jgi:threonine synthase
MLPVKCSVCGSVYPDTGLPYLCSACGGVFELGETIQFDPNLIDSDQPGLWKYWKSFGLKNCPESIYMGEGDTALVWDEVDGSRVGYKLEYQNPTGSYKDRGTSVLVGYLLERGIATVVEDSSGNAGASLAGYAARTGVKARIFVPSSASGPKREQIFRYGAELVSVEGPRSEAALRVRAEADAGTPYASHAYLPFGLSGIATIAYELYLQTGGEIGTIITPIGHGGLMLGIMHGFLALQKAGIIQSLARFIGAQAANCNPAERLFNGEDLNSVEFPLTTIAEGVRVSNPVRADEIVKLFRRIDGKIISVAEETILSSRNAMAKRGIYVEPTSAVCWSAYQSIKTELPDPVIMILTGCGYKYSTQ